MNIRDIRIDAFGSMRDRRFAPEGRITLFYGPNEAGKSTIMSFIRAVLFGLPPRSGAGAYEPPAGGTYGGALTLETDAGDAFRVERLLPADASGRGRFVAGRLKVTRLRQEDGSGRASAGAAGSGLSQPPAGQSPDEALLRELLGGVQGELFRSVFAFALSELQELGTLQSDEVAGFLYSAGWGAQGGAVVAAERRIAQEMDKLYRPRGKNQEIALLARRLDDGQAELRRSKEQTVKYIAWQEEAARLDAEIAAADEQLRDIRDEAAAIDRLRRSREHGLRLLAVERKLSRLPEDAAGGFPQDGLARFERLDADRLRLTEELRERTAKLGVLERELASIELDAELLADRPRLEALLERSGAYKAAKSAIAGLRAEAEAEERAAALALERLDGSWTPDRLVAYPLAVADREQAREAKAKRDELRRAEELARAEAGRAARELEEAARLADRERAAGEEAALALSAADASWEPSAAAMRRKLAQLGADYAEWSKLRQELDHVRQRERDYTLFREPAAGSRAQAGPQARHGRGNAAAFWRPMLPAAAAVVIPVLLWTQDAKGLAAATLLLFAATVWLTWPRPAASRSAAEADMENAAAPFAEERKQLGGQLARLERAVRERTFSWRLSFAGHAAAAAGVAAADGADGTAGPAAASLPEGWFAEARQAGEYWLEARGALEERQRQVEAAAAAAAEARRRREAAERLLAQAEGRLAACDEEWRGWLEERDMPRSLSPDSALEWQLVAEQGKQILQRREALGRRMAVTEAEAAAFERDAAALCGADSDPVYALKRRKAEAEAEESRRLERERLARESEALAIETALCRDKLENVRERIAGLWREAGTGSEERFREREGLHREQEALEGEREELSAALDSMLGADRRAEALQMMLRPPEELEDERERLARGQAETERLLDERRDRRGRLRNEMEKLEDGEEHADKLQKVQETIAELERHSRRWATLALAAALFAKTRALYETERQPAVLRKASGYLSAMTGGRYVRIVAPLGEKRLLAVGGDGEPLDSAKLSRGAAEQLYLAMRFALADETAQTAALPFVMDDVFVNFDGERLRRCLELLPALAERRQLLLFSCHEHVVREAAAAIPQLQVIRLQR